MANEDFKTKEPKTNCKIILCDPKNVIKVKRVKFIWWKQNFTENVLNVGTVQGVKDGAMNKTAKNPGP